MRGLVCKWGLVSQDSPCCNVDGNLCLSRAVVYCLCYIFLQAMELLTLKNSSIYSFVWKTIVQTRQCPLVRFGIYSSLPFVSTTSGSIQASAVGILGVLISNILFPHPDSEYIERQTLVSEGEQTIACVPDNADWCTWLLSGDKWACKHFTSECKFIY